MSSLQAVRAQLDAFERALEAERMAHEDELGRVAQALEVRGREARERAPMMPRASFVAGRSRLLSEALDWWIQMMDARCA
jgi:hypothetical protein